jgi:hypothetical protein
VQTCGQMVRWSAVALALLTGCGALLGVDNLKDRLDAAADADDGGTGDDAALDAATSLDAYLTGDPCQDKCILASTVDAVNELLAFNACEQGQCNDCALNPDAGPLPGGGSCPTWIPGRITSGNVACDNCIATECCGQVKSCWGDVHCSILSDCINNCP